MLTTIAWLIGLILSSNLWAAPSLKSETYRLANGLQVILQQDHSTPFVGISVWYHVGAVQESPGKTGFAHLFEHLMFEGSAHTGEAHYINLLEGIGASNLNGSTHFDYTTYYEVVPKNALEFALWLESDRMGWLLVNEERLNEQRGVVKNERLQNFDNQPYQLAKLQAWQTLFPMGHPYFGMIIGEMKDLDAASINDVTNFFQTYYTPANATLTIVGDYNPQTIKNIVEKYFGTLHGKTKPPEPVVNMPSLEKEIIIKTQERLGKLPVVGMYYITPSIFKKGDAELDLVSYVLTGDKSSRLTKRLLFEDRLVQDITARQTSMGRGSVFSIEAVLKNTSDPEKVIKIIDEEIQNLANTPPAQNELSKALNALETNQLFSLEKIGGGSGRTERLQTYNHYLGKPDSLEADLERYQQITPTQITSTVQEYLTPNKRVVLIAEPISQTQEGLL